MKQIAALILIVGGLCGSSMCQYSAAWPQQCDSVLMDSDMVASCERVIQCHHFRTSEQGVIAALDSDKAQLRACASLVLSDRWPKDAASPIEAAMLKESDQLTRVGLAWDLARLGDNAGREMLVSECHSVSEWGSTRVQAARWMSELHDDSCVDSVLDVLQADSDPQDDAKYPALDLVPSFIGRLTAQDSRRVLALVEKALDDPSGIVRLTASQTLVRLGDISAIPRLQAAAAKEQEETIRSSMSSDVKDLEKLAAKTTKQ